jgi:hypothetical protein
MAASVLLQRDVLVHILASLTRREAARLAATSTAWQMTYGMTYDLGLRHAPVLLVACSGTSCLLEVDLRTLQVVKLLSLTLKPRKRSQPPVWATSITSFRGIVYASQCQVPPQARPRSSTAAVAQPRILQLAGAAAPPLTRRPALPGAGPTASAPCTSGPSLAPSASRRQVQRPPSAPCPRTCTHRGRRRLPCCPQVRGVVQAGPRQLWRGGEVRLSASDAALGSPEGLVVCGSCLYVSSLEAGAIVQVGGGGVDGRGQL